MLRKECLGNATAKKRFRRRPLLHRWSGWGADYAPTMVQIAFCFGLIVATMVWCIGHVSGGHINPAVTVTLLITRKISVARAVLFVAAQCVGAIIGAAFLKVRTRVRFSTIFSGIFCC